MKTVLVIAFFAIVALAHADDEAQKEHFNKVKGECAEKTKFSEASIQKLHSHDYSDSENLGCFQQCFLQGAGIIKDGKFDVDTIHVLERVYQKEDANLNEKLEKCTPLIKSDITCENALEIFRCFH